MIPSENSSRTKTVKGHITKHGPSLLRFFLPSLLTMLRYFDLNFFVNFISECTVSTRKLGAFPNNDSLMRLVVSIAININDEWLVRKWDNVIHLL